jgi:2-keto-4-pentenoate hydratase/2-oxohepta-3-ene-1,7-dioic acid hydratase in catechol pathway
MRFRRVILEQDGGEALAVHDATADRWLPIAATARALGDPASEELPRDLIALLAGGEQTRELLGALCATARERDVAPACEPAPLLPFQPVLMRAFATSERHWLQSARGHVRRNMPRALPFISAVELITRRPFRPFRPGRLFYEEPAYYIGNALTFVPDGAEAPWPAYTEALDFELELGALVVREVRDASLAEACAAIGGFLVVNDLSARDTQWREIRHGIFGPLSKTKTFASSMSAEVVSADEILDRARRLEAEVRVNGEVWSRTDTADQRWSFEEMLVHASRGETVRPGELMSSGTLHDGCSLEIGRWVAPGDELELSIEGVGSVRNVIGDPR